MLSPDGRYRYQLRREFASHGGHPASLHVVMLNPSTAGAVEDDATIRRLRGFARRNGVTTLVVSNLFALRTPSPSELRRAADPIGPENRAWLRSSSGDHVVVGWGSSINFPPAFRQWWQVVVDILREGGGTLECWGRCADGHPRHPLFVAGDALLQPWHPPLERRT